MAQVKSMFGDASVTLPNGVTPDHPDWPAHWPKFDLGHDFDNEYQKYLSNPAAYTPPPKP
ncbi:MAG: hypothetical protein U5N55_11390 [Cypionkella sp.]|nr:hypothetical protein [Cypionkella sp.]